MRCLADTKAFRQIVAVGTTISARPRALLTHRAPPSGQTSCDERSSVARRPTRSPYSDRRGISVQYMLGVRFVAFPSRPGTRVRVWMRPPSTVAVGHCRHSHAARRLTEVGAQYTGAHAPHASFVSRGAHLWSAERGWWQRSFNSPVSCPWLSRRRGCGQGSGRSSRR